MLFLFFFSSFYLLCQLFWHPTPNNNSSQVTHFVLWNIFPFLPCLPVPFTSVPAQGWENVLPVCSRQIFILLGKKLRMRLGGGRVMHLYFLLCFSFWPLITEFAVRNGRERRFCFGQMLVTKISEHLCSVFCLDMNYLCDVM